MLDDVFNNDITGTVDDETSGNTRNRSNKGPISSPPPIPNESKINIR